MFSLRKPPVNSIRRFLKKQALLDFSYLAVGATATSPPADYVTDRTRIMLGSGESIFLAAKAALQRWEHFRLGWVELSSLDTPIQAGQIVAIMAWTAGLWTLNCCRIVYIVDESGPISKFGFAYGTLPGHVESGEELFQIEWDQGTNTVWYDILAFSRLNHFLTRLGYPLVRRAQKRFGRDSAAAIFRAVNLTSPLPEISQITG